jgi:hypothetical protein
MAKVVGKNSKVIVSVVAAAATAEEDLIFGVRTVLRNCKREKPAARVLPKGGKNGTALGREDIQLPPDLIVFVGTYG